MIPQTIKINGKEHRTVNQPEDFFRLVGCVFVKRMYLEKAGYTCMGHSHKHAHLSCLDHGAVMVSVGGKEASYYAPAFIDIPAGQHHQFTALVDDTVILCIHDTQGLVPEDLGEPYME